MSIYIAADYRLSHQCGRCGEVVYATFLLQRRETLKAKDIEVTWRCVDCWLGYSPDIAMDQAEAKDFVKWLEDYNDRRTLLPSDIVSPNSYIRKEAERIASRNNE